MAEQEVIKHTKKVFKIWNNDSHSTWQKIKEFLLEIFIIVFAVSLSIWLHDKSEETHQQKEVKEFLLGLREDLQSDIKEMESDKFSYSKQGEAFSYIAGIKKDQVIDKDSLQKYSPWLFNTTGLLQNNGRFEGFKASGKIGTIKDKQLQNNIMDLYQEDIPSLLASTNGYISTKLKLLEFVAQHRKRLTDSTTNLPAILQTDEAWNICGALSTPTEIIGRYNACTDKMKIIITAIENKYSIKE
jgi:hypothetical protein